MPSSRDVEWVASGWISAETWDEQSRKTQRLELKCEYCGSKTFQVSFLNEAYSTNFKCASCGAEMEIQE